MTFYHHYPNITINHGFFNNTGGVSIDEFSSLNLKYMSGDNEKNILQNYQRVSKKINVSPDQLIILKQVHSNKCVVINDTNKIPKHNTLIADAAITNNPEVVLCVLTADCLPILLYDPNALLVASIHCGFKGLTSGIILNTISQMQQLGSKLENINVLFGPSIQQQYYEVSCEIDISTQEGINIETCLLYESNKYYFNIPKAAEIISTNIGILKSNIYNQCNFDTYSNHTFYSYRRNTHNKIINYGNQLSFIQLKESY